MKRDLVLAISQEFFAEINGTTDSEIMFYLALTFGMAEDVTTGVARMVGFIEQVGRRHGIDNTVQMSLGISDGRSLYGFRYSTVCDSRTLHNRFISRRPRHIELHIRCF